jgi:hypothetical protein
MLIYMPCDIIPADHGRTGGIPGEGGNEWGLGAKENKVSWDVSVIDREEH